VDHLALAECPRCGRTDDPRTLLGVCECGSPLLIRYDLDAVREAVTPAEIASRPADLWRYRELLPVSPQWTPVSLGEGWTPMLGLPAYGRSVGIPRLMVKDEGLLPTGSFKARGAAVGVTRAVELGVSGFAMPTNGNAGAAWALYAARARLRAVIAMPHSAPVMPRREILAAGAELHLVDGLIGDAGRLVTELVAASEGTLFNASTLREPYRIEGKKTMGLEIAEQLGWRVPDVIVYPAGGGVGLIGIHKGLSELRTLGWLPDGRLPRLVAVQASGCAPIVKAFQAGQRRAEPWPDAHTVAFGINVPAPLGDELMLDAITDTGGTAVAVDDADTLAELAAAARLEGLLLCPEGAACLAAVRRLAAEGWLGAGEEVVVINTGSALKYPEALDDAVGALDSAFTEEPGPTGS
jgi:threonine synthase